MGDEVDTMHVKVGGAGVSRDAAVIMRQPRVRHRADTLRTL